MITDCIQESVGAADKHEKRQYNICLRIHTFEYIKTKRILVRKSNLKRFLFFKYLREFSALCFFSKAAQIYFFFFFAFVFG